MCCQKELKVKQRVKTMWEARLHQQRGEEKATCWARQVVVRPEKDRSDLYLNSSVELSLEIGGIHFRFIYWSQTLCPLLRCLLN